MEQRIKTLVMETAEILMKKDARLVTVESCTGGGVGYFCTQLAGASRWYERGHITYQNKAKQDLGVPADILNRHGAVSRECANAMALAGLDGLVGPGKSYYSLAVTGVAGPDGGSDEKPVGTVCFGWAQSAAGTGKTAITRFKGDRHSIRMESIVFALRGLNEFIIGNANAEPPISRK